MVCAGKNEAQKREKCQMRVLVVEDDELTAAALGKLLIANGFAVRTAHNYKAALKVACEWLPDVLVSDIRLPDKDGCEVIRCLQSAHPKLKGIAVSGCTAPDNVGRILAAGFFAYLPKPIEVDRLCDTIHRVLVMGDDRENLPHTQ